MQYRLQPLHDLKVNVTVLEVLCKSSALKFKGPIFFQFKGPNFFPNPMMYLVHVWNDDRDLSKIISYMFYCILNIAIVFTCTFL